MIDKKRIGIITTVSNWALYKKTSLFFPEGIKIFTIDGTTGFYGLKSITFFLKKLKVYNLDWLIMADEDVIFINPDGVFDLISFMENDKYTVAGMRDGGVLQWRDKNPHMINHFFAILNLKEIYPIYMENEVLKNQFIVEDEFPKIDLPYKNFDEYSLFEPYYCFYLWLLRKGKKIKYLDAVTPFQNDFATTLLFDQEGRELLYHTWYARFYKKNKFHTARIEKVISITENLFPIKNSPKKPLILQHRIYDVRFYFYKWSRRILRVIRKK